MNKISKILISAVVSLNLAGSGWIADSRALASERKLYPTVSPNLISNFNNGMDSWLILDGKDGISRISDESNEANKSVSLAIGESGGSVTMARNFRSLRTFAVCEFKIMPQYGDGEFDVYIYDRGSRPVKLFTVCGNEIRSDGGVVAKCKSDSYTKLSIVISPYNTYSLYADEVLVKNDVPVLSLRSISSISAVKFVFNSDDKACVRVDDVYAYEGRELMNEFSILNDTDKAIYRTRNAVAYVSGYGECYVNGARVSLENGAVPVLSDGKFLVPLCYTLSSLGIKANYEDRKVIAEVNGVTHTFTIGTDNVISSDGRTTVLSSAVMPTANDVLVCGDDIVSIFGFSKYFDNEDMLVLSKGLSVYESTDDIGLLSSVLKTQITNLIYTSDSLGRRVKIGSSTELFNAKLIPVHAVSAEYIPESQNPPEAAVDGDLSTRYTCDKNDKTLDIDLGEIKNISAYAIAWYNGSQRKNHYTIHYSEDGVTWSTLPKVYSTGTSDNYEYTETAIKARYLKYQGFGTYANDGGTQGLWNSISEIAFFEEG